MKRYSRHLILSTSVFSLVSLVCLAQSPADAGQNPAERRTVGQSDNATSSGQLTPPSAQTAKIPPEPDPVGEAVALLRKGDFDAAAAKYKELLRKQPKSPDAYAGLIRTYLKRKDITQAETMANEALGSVDSPRIRVAYAEVLFRKGDIDLAEIEWAKAINGGYPEARAYLGLARVRNARAMYKSAQAMIKRAHELDPSDPDIEELWVETLSRRDRIEYLEQALKKPNGWNDEKRQDTSQYLQALKEQEKVNYQPCRLVAGTGRTEIPFVMLLGEDTSWSGWGLTVYLNGHKTTLQLDTGASGIVLGRKAAERAGIAKIGPYMIGGVGDKGRQNGYVGFADQVQVGNQEFEGCPVQITESRSVLGSDGLIGSDVFHDFLVDLDFPSATLRLSPLPKRPGETDQASIPEDGEGKARSLTLKDSYIAPEMESFTRVFLFGHDLLVPTTVGAIPGKLFLLDTGAFNNAMSPVAARDVTKVHGNPHELVKGLSGSVKKVYIANKVVIQFGRLRQENQDLVVFDISGLSDEDGTEISGFLGFRMLRFLDMKIDYRDGLVDFSYDPERWKNWQGP